MNAAPLGKSLGAVSLTERAHSPFSGRHSRGRFGIERDPTLLQGKQHQTDVVPTVKPFPNGLIMELHGLLAQGEVLSLSSRLDWCENPLDDCLVAVR